MAVQAIVAVKQMPVWKLDKIANWMKCRRRKCGILEEVIQSTKS
jgi:hypothetical protein